MDRIAQVLHPIEVVVWGEDAIATRGAGVVVGTYIIIPSASDFDLCVQKLAQADYTPHPWSYMVLDGMKNLPDNELGRLVASRIDPMNCPDYRKIDDNSVRFGLPVPNPGKMRVVVLRSDYVGLSPPKDPSSLERFLRHENLFYPDVALLLESFIRVLLKEDFGHWRSTLEAWAISYVYGLLKADDDVLDNCENEEVKAWFNKHIRRGKGGLDRGISKRYGKGQPST